MPELRKDPVIGRWVIIATERGKRPSDFGSVIENKKRGFCPFCEGNEHITPPEILAYRKPGTQANKPGWNVRVVPNKFPALQIEGELDKRGDGMFDKMNGIGAHEVIIETPDHNKGIADLDITSIESVFWAYRARLQDLKKDKRFKYILIFKNHGAAAGASLEHSHTQLIATPIVPKRVMEELKEAKNYYEYKERCIFCDIIRQEMKDNIRVVCQNDKFITIAPFASRFPFEMWLLPKFHICAYEDMEEKMYILLAELLKETLLRLKKTLTNPPYNFIIHTTPARQNDLEYYHWHIEIIPKLTKVAGFEWGSGFYINPTPPEEATKYLKEVKI